MNRYTYNLNGTFALTTDSPASCYGVPVLLNLWDGGIFGPADLVPEYAITAKELVLDLSDGCDTETMAAVESFLRSERPSCRPWYPSSG